ncbi:MULTISPECIES: extracellular solute-binding protein [Hyphomicrobium]|uniref:extracellular solute-binding protein n=1 Tax=Hyphomicrobium TaxID=81 RepID=UPI0018DC29B4|nr:MULTISPECIES: extracellular solute-binding protein [Hyphomicrobium]WBT39408.1 extracellular solute-binding protein [Hyphomicrobium sp. DMF-1]HML43408.1 extracellular solute-binding protein [Hyphomicrobium zavarzinii]
MRRLLGVRAGLTAFCALAFAAGLASPLSAEPKHGLSIFGDLKYPADFTHFDYVNPDAPKGGKASQIGTAGLTTFDSFNAYILKGDAAQGMELVFDTLMARALDEPDAVYGLVASSADVAPDGLSVTFKLRPEAKFADGSPLTADDVVFSFDTIKAKGHPAFAIPLKDVVSAEALDPQTVRYTFQGQLIRDLPISVATLPILSKAYYTAHDFEKTTLEPPLGSGPYKIGDFKAGTYVTYVRREDYWGKDLPINRGQHNFDEVRYEYYRDRTLELENLLAGNFDFREEFTSKDWAGGYDKPAVKDGRVKLLTIPDERPSGAQGFFINTRRDKFKDVRVREALGLAFDFEWSNKNLFFGLYTRTGSYFENSDMKASGVPSPEELALLEPFRDKLPAAVFGEAVSPPVTDGSGNNREQLRRASKLLAEAGWTQTPQGLRNAAGQPFSVEILIDSPSFERIVGPYLKNLKAIGIDATMRRVDAAQYERRLKDFDFDLTTQRYALRLTPGIELKTFWGSDAAKTNGSFNLAGIADPVLDQLIDHIVTAKSRAELVTATRAADRVLRAGYYWVPQWYKGAHNLAFWNKFGWPEVKPRYERGALDTWWYDSEKAKALVQR